MNHKNIEGLVGLWTEWNKHHTKAMQGDNKSAQRCEELVMMRYAFHDAIDKEFENAVKKYRRNH